MNPFKKLSVKTINAVLIFLVMGVFLVVILLCHQAVNQLITDSFWQRHSYDVVVALDALESDLLNAETGQRGYIITGIESFLEPYTAALQNVDKDFQILQDLIKDNPAQEERLSTMQPLIDTKIVDLENSVTLRKDKGFNEASKDVLTEKGKQTMDSIRKIITVMETEEFSLRKIRVDNTGQTTSKINLLLIWGGIIGLLFYLLVNYVINRFVIGEIVKKSLFDKELQANKIIESANKELRSLDLAKDEFVSIASHQLRTPLTVLKGYIGMLLDGDPGPINDKQREYLGEMEHANNRMIELITALLNVSRVDLGVFSVEPEPLNIEEIAESVLKDLAFKIKEKGLHMQSSFEKGLPLLSADPKIIRMVFQNLLTNAVKYTPEEGNITLDVKKDSSSFLISVTDTGYGIPESAKSKIFTKMFRADNARTKDPDGTGLGLYIIKATIEQTGGKIWFESKENQGSTFYVSIPLEGMKKKEGSKNLQ